VPRERQHAGKLTAIIHQGDLGQKEVQKFLGLVRRTSIENPKRRDVQDLQRMLTRSPRLWRAMGDLANTAIQVAIGGGWLSEGVRISIEAGIEELKRDFGYEDAPPIEKLLIDQIIVCSVQLQKTQLQYGTMQREGLSISSANFWERRITMANSRFLRACETLARVRKLGRPGMVQVNIGAQQLNVAPTGGDEKKSIREEMKVIEGKSSAPANGAESPEEGKVT
jgi:hypothetical protein